MYRDAPAVGRVAVFEQIDALPCAQHHAACNHGDAERDGQYCRLDMRGHVIWSFIIMFKYGITIGTYTDHEAF